MIDKNQALIDKNQAFYFISTICAEGRIYRLFCHIKNPTLKILYLFLRKETEVGIGGISRNY